MERSLVLVEFDRTSRDRKGANVSPDFRLFFRGVLMHLRSTNADEKLPVKPYGPQPSRDRKGADVSPDLRLFFKGVVVPIYVNGRPAHPSPVRQ